MRQAVVVFGLMSSVGCAHGTKITKVGVDTFRITCPEMALDQCLTAAVDNACDKRGYFVARGLSDVNRRGRSEAPDISKASEAIVRCAPANGWGDQGKELMGSPDGAPAPAPATASAPAPAAIPAKPPANICAPGSTQACIGAAACPGGQACKADGSGYEPCDCGAPASAPAPAPG